jgi:hypothetical protein
LQEKGVPMPVQRTMICPPRCRMGAITPEERAAVRARSPVGPKYDTTVNRESAHEMLQKKAQGDAPGGGAPSAGPATTPSPAPEASGGVSQKMSEWLWGTKRRQGMVETMAKQTARTMGSKLGNQILRGVLGGIFKSR